MVTPLENPAVATDLISFLKALPDCRLRRGIRYPQWWMLLVSILAILSNQGSLLGMERFPKRHRKTLNELLGTHIAKPPSDSTFRLLLAQLDVDVFEAFCSSGWQRSLASLRPSTPWCVTARLCGVQSIKPPLAQCVLSLR
ncbi:transposase family protein [Cyanobium sp. HWJ4-Hawea]|uniref:transposase family protein n=1 Tax=Cyanobium sp. HWJ4-Hawea TaxID=2823713 RepID=UPI0020CDF6C1|nr:transposase family protein [Cyanobium sp. HWJ4-Hawea]